MFQVSIVDHHGDTVGPFPIPNAEASFHAAFMAGVEWALGWLPDELAWSNFDAINEIQTNAYKVKDVKVGEI